MKIVRSVVSKSGAASSFALVASTLIVAPLAHAQSSVSPSVSPTPKAPSVQTAKTYDHSMDAQLRRATNADNDGSVLSMLARGADPNLKDTDAWKSPLVAQAAFIGNLKMVRAFVEAGADINATSTQGATAMDYATTRNRHDIIRYLRQQGASVNARNSAGQTLLMGAVAMGNVETVRTLLALGADVNARSSDGSTALHKAVNSSFDAGLAMQMVKVLVEAGADVSVEANGKFANGIAGENKLYDINKYLVDIYNRDNALFDASAQAAGLRDGVFPNAWADKRKALDNGANGRFSNAAGSTALILFALDAKGFDEATAKRIIAVSDINAQEENGNTALHAACDRFNTQMVALLIKAGANLQIKDKYGKTPLESAVSRENTESAALLRAADVKSTAPKTSTQLQPNASTATSSTRSTPTATPTATSKATPLPPYQQKPLDIELHDAVMAIRIKQNTTKQKVLPSD